ncbi:hypothetical protein B0I35DRAFT_447348 [Stachybotrys elegans]|uniref:Uncharacterized protein n=1 Tax=Stachybotrys elegans TaxID=80388 RepID=A0A8K0SCA0_9HYPO|nr:hypothetical protein B0I35DRAFT_447348 [Stachybotrys elegans]
MRPGSLYDSRQVPTPYGFVHVAIPSYPDEDAVKEPTAEPAYPDEDAVKEPTAEPAYPDEGDVEEIAAKSEYSDEDATDDNLANSAKNKTGRLRDANTDSTMSKFTNHIPYPEDYPDMLNPDTSYNTMRKYLVPLSGQPIQYDALISWQLVQAFLRAKHATNELKDAAKIRYTENAFTVSHYLLHDFFYNPNNTTELNEPITALVRRITVTIPTELRARTQQECSNILHQLRILLECSNLQSVDIHLIGDGQLTGIDWPTQDAIRVIAPVVQDLITMFQGRFSIHKILKHSRAQTNITSYWPKPRKTGFKTSKSSTAGVEQMMKEQVEHWIKMV